jgi:hypothetical protein
VAAKKSLLGGNQRLALRLFLFPALAVGVVLMFNGMHDRFVLPECDSDNAKHTLADVLKQLNFEPMKYEPIKTVSSSKTEVVCNAVLPLPDGANVVVDYTFFWQGSKSNMKYSIARHAAQPQPSAPLTK